jgi:hypothetical protein
MKRILITAAAGAAALAGSLALAAPAMASNGPLTVVAVTHLNNHPDTTDATGPAILPGNVWAYDNATEKYTMVQQPDGSWKVTMGYVGSFHGFADPSDTAQGGAALISNGSVKGTMSATVTSPNTPNPSLLPGQSASDAHIGDNIQALFGNDSSTKVMGLGDVYTFSYQNGNYVQDQPLGGQYTATGDVTGH